MASIYLQTLLDTRNVVVNRKHKGMALKELTFWLEEISKCIGNQQLLIMSANMVNRVVSEMQGD